MNINIYYGGRGIIEDPTLYVLKLIENVLDELHVKFTRYNLYELKNGVYVKRIFCKDDITTARLKRIK